LINYIIAHKITIPYEGNASKASKQTNFVKFLVIFEDLEI